MKIIAFDTTTKFLVIAAYDNGYIYEYVLESGMKHSLLLVPAIERILKSLGWRKEAVDYYACGLGPGSFTGIRVGLSVAKGLAWSLDKPVVGIPTLDALAYNAAVKGNQDRCRVACLIDAKRNLVYACSYQISSGALKRMTPYTLAPVADLLKRMAPGTILTGDGLGLYKDWIIRRAANVVLLDKDYWYPQGRFLIKLALEKIRRKQVATAAGIKAIYLYPKECQVAKTPGHKDTRLVS